MEQTAIHTQLLETLSQTPYQCSILTPIASRPNNFVFRGALAQPLTKDGHTVTSIIVKQTVFDWGFEVDIKRSKFEEHVLNGVAADLADPSETPVAIRTPRLLLTINKQNFHIQVFEEFSNTSSFKANLFSLEPRNKLPDSSLIVIGHRLGSWLKEFHSWSSAPEQASLRAKFLTDDPARQIKRSFTFCQFLGLLDDFPELLEGYDEILQTIHDSMNKEFEKPPSDGDENWGLVHGDLWSGNFLVDTDRWNIVPSQEEKKTVYIIDFEFAQFGHRSYDLGQIVGDMCERKVFNGSDTGMLVVQGIIAGYGPLSDELAFRVAIYVGMHLILWYSRRPRKGPWIASSAAIVEGLATARDFIVKGWEKDRTFFEDSLLALLFSAS